MNARIIGTAAHVPKRTEGNTVLEELWEKPDGYVARKTEFQLRHLANPQTIILDSPALPETLAGMGAHVLLTALGNAGVRIGDLDKIIVSSTGVGDVPTIAAQVSALAGGKEGLTEGIPFTAIDNACSGMIYGLNQAAAEIAADRYETVAVVATEIMAPRMHPMDRSRMIFEDGAAAVIVQASPIQGYVASVEHGYPSMSGYIVLADDVWDGDLDVIERQDTLSGLFRHAQSGYLTLPEGPMVKFWGIGAITDMTREILEKTGYTLAEIDYGVPHLANGTMLTAARQIIAEKFAPSKMTLVNFADTYANSVSAAVGIQLHEMVMQKYFDLESRVIFYGFGAGLATAASLWKIGPLQYGDSKV